MDEMVQKVLEQQEQVEVVNSGMKGNYVPPYGLFRFIQPDLQVLSLLEVCDCDNMTSVVVDHVELRHPLICCLNVLSLVAANLQHLLYLGQPLHILAVVLQSQLGLLQVEANAEVPPTCGRELDWLNCELLFA